MKEGLRYAVPLLALCGVTLLLLRARRYRPLDGRVRVALTAVAAAPLVASATVHLLRPSLMVALLPPWLPERTWLIMATGLPELAGALGLFFAATRRPAATWLSVMMIAIFPANIYVAGQRVGGLAMPGVPVAGVRLVPYRDSR
jgi:uncharacterized membrane protein